MILHKSIITQIINWVIIIIIGVILLINFSSKNVLAAKSTDYTATPPFVSAGVPPLVMLVMGRDHKLYYEAYNDASDLNDDGKLDVGYTPEKIGTAPDGTTPASADYRPAIDYYGYFDSYKYYSYSTTNSRFEPAGVTDDKKAPSGDYWSGDFLNYLTMSRMDCLRKVLYGGYRSTDTATETVLERVYIPRDAHSWGKEYQSVARDGFNIEDYTPLSLPQSGTYHLFASTTVTENGPPVLRVLPNNTNRIWMWVAKERPVCDNSLESSGGYYTSHPSDHSTFDSLKAQFGTSGNLQGTWTNDRIDSSNDNLSDNNPYDSDNEHYMTIFTGTINIPNNDTYQFAVDGDDAVEVIIDGTVVAGWYNSHGSCSCNTYKGSITLTAGNHSIEFRHEENTGGDSYFLRWNQGNSINSWQIVPAARYPSGLTQNFYELKTPESKITDYVVRVKVCDASIGLEPNSKLYSKPDGSDTVYKPVGILQRHGESDRMYFGLLTGSYRKNTSGDVLRKNIRSITDEINPDTGEFVYKDTTTTEGIIRSIDSLKTVDFSYGDWSYNSNCGWIATRAVNEGECRMWGNPIAEMIYETLRYFAGAKASTSTFDFTDSATDSKNDDYNDLNLPHPKWRDPYSNAEDIDGDDSLDTGEDWNNNGIINGFDYCAKPFMLVLSDINPSYDSDQLPGTAFGTGITPTSGIIDDIDVEDLSTTISNNEGDIAGSHFIGKSGATFDGACTPKTVAGLSNIQGLCPEEPTKQGSYYSAAVAYYGNITDVNKTASGDQKVSSYCVGLASPLPRIDIKVGDKTITVVPFAKSVGGYSINAAQGQFQPTNTIVDFFVDKEYGISNVKGKFRINYEDVEQGADHDMDAIVEYTYQVVDLSGNPVTDPTDGVYVDIKLDSTYAAGSIIQHMGYIISGTTNDGTYLEVVDQGTGTSDPDYFLDTPPGQNPGGIYNDGVPLPLVTTRRFTPSTSASSTATLLKNPLWYAAKWGGFKDYNDDDIPNTDNNDPTKNNEWDSDQNEIPDTYFYVQNPLKLEEQLNKSFADILRRTSSGTAASVISQSRSGEGAVYQAIFYPEYKDTVGNTISWAGSLHALFVDNEGNMREDTDHDYKLDNDFKNGDYDNIVVFDGTVLKKYSKDEDGNKQLDFSGSIDDIEFLWRATDWLNHKDLAASTQRLNYSDTTPNRYIFTFADSNQNMIADSDEVQPFEYPTSPPSDFTDTSTIFPYINIFPTFEDESSFTGPSIATLRSNASLFSEFQKIQYERVINYIRGEDQGEYPPEGVTSSLSLPAFRSRQAYSEKAKTLLTWRLGDIVYSTPTVVGRPAENYHILYNDKSYGQFVTKYNNRRQVIYAGANDGMIHAFNGGFFDNKTTSFNKTGNNSEKEYELGQELWAYVPYNLLPHLYWLTEEGYPHVYYNDLTPKIFDAKILPDDTHYSDSDSDLNWGTFLVAGMRLGGGEIKADMDKDGVDDGDDDRTMKSAYCIFDITDPEQPPILLAELSFDGLGYTTCLPAVIPMKKDGANEWYLIFGSGPADSSGYPASMSDDADILTKVISKQKGKFFVVDLKALKIDKKIKTLKDDGTGFADGVQPYQEIEDNSFISDPSVVDFNLDFSAEAAYFGTVEGNSSQWNGRMRRVVIENNIPSAEKPWNTSSDSKATLIQTPNQPISAKPNISVDDKGRLWVYFGTGRFFVKTDETITTQQTYYGIIEPFYDNPSEGYLGYFEIYSEEDVNENCILDEGEDIDGDNKLKDPPDHFTWLEVINPKATSGASLIDVSEAVIKDDKSVSGITFNSQVLDKWSYPDDDSNANKGLINSIDRYTTNGGGWFMDFRQPYDLTKNSEKERNLYQSSVFGEMVMFTSYTPSGNMCEFQGVSNLYAVYYKTGTPYYEDVMFDADGNSLSKDDGTGKKIMAKLISLGDGLASTPNIHSGSGGDGNDSAFIQTSTGDIINLKQKFPVRRNFGIVTWKEGQTECN